MLTALSIQLALYAIAWFLMGLAFGLHRQVVLAWSAGWAMLSGVTAVLGHAQWPVASALGPVMNTLTVSSFVALMWGCGKAYGKPTQRWHVVLPLVGAVLVDLLRYHWFEETTTIRLLGFIACIAWPIFRGTTSLTSALKHIGFVQLSSLVWLPGLLVVSFFSLRAYWVSDGGVAMPRSFAGHTELDQRAIALFLFLLGSFNFAQASYVIGRLVRRLRNLSDTDQLTHLANRRTLMRQLAAEEARFHRSGQPYAVLMIDLDHFKLLNDTYGHQAGDLALKAISSTVKNAVRTNDTLARYGGEEFVLLMPDTTTADAQVLAERIRDHIAALSIAVGAQTVSVTASIGIAISAVNEVSYENVIKRADDALYQAKHHGRNCVIVSA